MKNVPPSLAIVSGLIVGILFADLATPQMLSLGALYVLAVWAIAQTESPEAVVGVAGVATALTLATLFFPHPPAGAESGPLLGARLVSVIVIWSGAIYFVQDLKQRRKAAKQHELHERHVVEEQRHELAVLEEKLEAEHAKRRQGDAARLRLVDILERTPEMIFIARADHRLVYLNSAGRELLGLAADADIAALTIEDCFPSVSAKMLEDQVVAGATRDGSWQGDFRVARSEGEDVPVSLVMLAHKKSSGDVEYFAGVARDITHQHQVELAMRESEARMLAIFEVAIDCILTIDEQGKILEFNRASEVVFRVNRREVIGQEMAELFFPPESRERHRANLHRYQTSGGGSMLGRRLELTMHRSDGEEFIAQIAIQPVSLKGQPVFSVFLQDITKRKEQELLLAQQTKELARSNTELAQFAYVASHDLQEPLRAVHSHCQILQRKLEDKLDDSTRTCLNFAVDGAERMQRLINDMLSYSRVGTRGKPFEP
ncbi:MAG: PAS domain S-box protein, partial [Planctomycetales bacterium]|nr:PAS domain S-box protein [Planctomycetales bacterium]